MSDVGMEERVKLEYIDAQMVLRLTVDGRGKYVTMRIPGESVRPMLQIAEFALNAAIAAGQATPEKVWAEIDEIMGQQMQGKGGSDGGPGPAPGGV